MRKAKFDKTATHSIMRMLDSATSRHGLPLTKYAATKWADAQRDRERILKRKEQLEKELADVTRRLSR